MENLHPIVVHFPIALLTIYSLLEIASLFSKIRNNKAIWYIKMFLVITGWLGVQAALSTGENAAHAGFGTREILQWHELFANISVWMYGISAIGYALQWFLFDGITTLRGKKVLGTMLHMVIQKIVFWFNRYGIGIIFGIAGLVALTVTGALGGAMVYGTTADPMVKIVTQLLHIQ